ncbi:eCIS core domain-containing protein [Tenacibaculum xiamenense]|uniref:eCIS core domain-containing protein n=1 Tax=Tenacibaculum xiamenense TaxID=1261553 RepID=UPI00389673A6
MFLKDKKTNGPSTPSKKKSSFIQPKLKTGKPGDKYEVEADKMADKVVNKPDSSDTTVFKKEAEDEVQQKPLASEVTPWVQKKEMGEEESVQQKTEEEESVQKMEEEEAVQKQEEEESVQKMEEEEAVQKQEEEESVQKMEEDEGVQQQEEEEVQTKKAGNAGVGAIEGKLKRGTGGSKMDARTKREMESGFGADFSNVKIHTDSEAQRMSADIGAQAFTHGNDIYFNKGKYNPGTTVGKHLLAHELTHTIQQKGMTELPVQRKSVVPGSENKDKNQLKKYKTAFPYFYKYMTSHFGEYLTGSEKIKKALLKNSVGILTEEKIKETTDFEKGNGPKIELVEFPNPDQHGEYFYQGNTIKLDYRLVEKYEEIMSNPKSTAEQKNAISISLNQVLINEFTHYGDALDDIDAIKDDQGNVVNNMEPGEGLEGNFTSKYDEGNEAVAEIFEFYGTTMIEGLQNYAAHAKGIYLDPDTLKEIEKDPSLIDESLIPPIPKIEK